MMLFLSCLFAQCVTVEAKNIGLLEGLAQQSETDKMRSMHKYTDTYSVLFDDDYADTYEVDSYDDMEDDFY